MKIVYLVHSLHRRSGVESVLTSKVNYLAEVYGYEICIVTARQKGRPSAYELTPKVTMRDMGDLDRTLAELSPDIAIAIGDRQMKALLKSKHHCHKLSEFHFSHEKFHMKYGRGVLGKAYAEYRTRRLEKLAGQFEKFIVLTEADRKDWEKILGNVCAISNPISFKFNPVPSAKQKRCIAVGRLEDQKNFEDAIRIWKYVDEKHPDWVLDIFGEGSLRNRLENRIINLGLEGKVRLRGNSKKITKEMSESCLLLMTSKFEGEPMVLLESLEVGIPTVSYDCPKGPSEIIEEGENGFLLPPGDIKGMADAVCKLIESGTLRDSMAAKAKERASLYDMEAIMSRWNRLFLEL